MKTKLQEGRGRRGWRLGESGQALIEAAIAAPLLFLVLVGGAELARVAYAAIEIQNAAEAAALYGAQTPGAVIGTTNTGAQQVAQSDAGNLTGVNATYSTTPYCSDGSAPDPTTSSCSTGIPETMLNVTTTVSFDPLIHIPGLPSTFNLGGHASEMCGYC